MICNYTCTYMHTKHSGNHMLDIAYQVKVSLGRGEGHVRTYHHHLRRLEDETLVGSTRTSGRPLAEAETHNTYACDVTICNILFARVFHTAE